MCSGWIYEKFKYVEYYILPPFSGYVISVQLSNKEDFFIWLHLTVLTDTQQDTFFTTTQIECAIE